MFLFGLGCFFGTLSLKPNIDFEHNLLSNVVLEVNFAVNEGILYSFKLRSHADMKNLVASLSSDNSIESVV
jgi:hypothetical protein